MRATVNVNEFLLLLKKMKPKSAGRKALREPVVSITAGGTSVILMGDFDNSASATAEISEHGSGLIPLVPAIRVLSTYPRNGRVELKAEPGAFWLDKLRLPAPSVA